MALSMLLAGMIAGISQTTPSLTGAQSVPSFDSTNTTSTIITLSANSATSTMRLGGIYTGNPSSTATGIGNINRKYATIQNVGAGVAFCSMSATSTNVNSSTYGFALMPSSTVNSLWSTGYQGGNVYSGQVFCAAGTTATTLTVTEH